LTLAACVDAWWLPGVEASDNSIAVALGSKRIQLPPTESASDKS